MQEYFGESQIISISMLTFYDRMFEAFLYPKVIEYNLKHLRREVVNIERFPNLNKKLQELLKNTFNVTHTFQGHFSGRP